MSKTRERILRKAFQIFSKKGYEGARIEDISRAARLNKATIYYYFRNKKELYKEVLYQQTKLFINMVLEAFEKASGEEELIKSVVDACISFVEKYPDMFVLQLREICSGGRYLRETLKRLVEEDETLKSGGIASKFKEWGFQRKIPISTRHLWLNILGMSISHFITRPFIEEIYQIEVNEDFIEERKRSIIKLLESALD